MENQKRTETELQPNEVSVQAARRIVYDFMPPTPMLFNPSRLSSYLPCQLGLKLESLTPIGAFKIRGSLVYCHRRRGAIAGLVSATRGNHGQALALAGRHYGMAVTIFVPRGNSETKNAGMRFFGARLIEHGADFQEAAEQAAAYAAEHELHLVPSFHTDLVEGVTSSWLEVFEQMEATLKTEPDVIYVPIGMGSGATAALMARRIRKAKTKIIGVVAEQAPSYFLSFQARRPVATNEANTCADGLACRTPNATALAWLWDGLADVVKVSESAIQAAVRLYQTHANLVVEGAAAAPLAAALENASALAGKSVVLPVTGGNVDTELYRSFLAGRERAATTP